MKLWKKSLSLLLTVCLLVTGLTMSATAAEVSKVEGDFFAGANLNLNEGIAIQFLTTTTALSVLIPQQARGVAAVSHLEKIFSMCCSTEINNHSTIGQTIKTIV